MNQHNFQLSAFLKFLQLCCHTNRGQIMRYINELAPHTSEWEFLSQCSRETKSGRDFFVDRCSHLERLFGKLGLPLDEFYWSTYDDELELDLRIDFHHIDQFKNSAKLIKKFLEKHFPIDDLECFDNFEVLDPEKTLEQCWGSYVRAFKDHKIVIRLKINDYGYNYHFASAIYLDACLHYA